MSQSGRPARTTRTRGRQRTSHLGQVVNLDLTPMVDIIFLLIIFFLVTTTFVDSEAGIPIDLPSAPSASLSINDLPTVTINANREILVNNAVIPTEQLSTVMEDELTRIGTSNVVLRADQSVPHGIAVEVIDLLKQAGAERISIAAGE